MVSLAKILKLALQLAVLYDVVNAWGWAFIIL
jgi:hypothetical protein